MSPYQNLISKSKLVFRNSRTLPSSLCSRKPSISVEKICREIFLLDKLLSVLDETHTHISYWLTLFTKSALAALIHWNYQGVDTEKRTNLFQVPTHCHFANPIHIAQGVQVFQHALLWELRDRHVPGKLFSHKTQVLRSTAFSLH